MPMPARHKDEAAASIAKRPGRRLATGPVDFSRINDIGFAKTFALSVAPKVKFRAANKGPETFLKSWWGRGF
jgi:hypothetical protein